MLNVLKPFAAAYTAPQPKTELWAKPTIIAAINPNGEIIYNSFNLILLVLEKSGASVTDNNIGIREIDNRTETKINKFTFIGSLIFNKKLPRPEKPKIIIKYIERIFPLL